MEKISNFNLTNESSHDLIPCVKQFYFLKRYPIDYQRRYINACENLILLLKKHPEIIGEIRQVFDQIIEKGSALTPLNEVCDYIVENYIEAPWSLDALSAIKLLTSTEIYADLMRDKNKT